MKRSIFSLLSVVVMASLLLAACSGPSVPASTLAPTNAEPTLAAAAPTSAAATAEPNPAPTQAAPTAAPAATEASTMGMLPEVDPAAFSGDVIASGSSTVYPLAEAMAVRFKDEGFGGNITLASIGSGAGFERFCKNAETDIANASRKIKDSEVEACKANNRTPIEFRVGTDALAIVVSQQNDFLTNVTLDELAKIYSKDFVKWSDVNPAWPKEDIERFSPGTDSGTFDFFVETVMAPAYNKDVEAGKTAILDAPGIQLSENDNVLVQGVEGSPYAIGYFGYAYFNENADKLKTVSVEGVAPNFNTAESGTYKLSRPLFIYSDAQIMKDKPQVAAFINFFVTFVDEEIGKVGYFPASDEALQVSAQNWLDATK